MPPKKRSLRSKATSHESEDELSNVHIDNKLETDASDTNSFTEGAANRNDSQSEASNQASSQRNGQRKELNESISQLRADKKNLSGKLKRRDAQIQKLKDQIREKSNGNDIASPKHTVKLVAQCEHRIETLQNIMKQKDDHIKLLENTLDLRARSTVSSAPEMQKLLDHGVLTESRMLSLQEQVSKLKEQLLCCQDDVFRLQPIPQHTDGEIQNQYGALCTYIMSWAEEEISDFEQTHQNSIPYQQAMKDGGDPYIKSVLKKFDAAEYLLGSIIHTVIVDSFFGEDIILFGLNDEMEKLIRDIEKNMENSGTDRDPATIKGWRADTLQAMIKIPQIVKEREQAIQVFTENLFQKLCAVFPPLNKDSKCRLQQEVTRRTAILEANIHCSLTKYRFENIQGGLQKFMAVDQGMLGRFSWVDVESRKVHRGGFEAKADKYGNVGVILLQLESGVMKVERNGQEIVLHPLKYLLKLNEPLPKQQKKGSAK